MDNPQAVISRGLAIVAIRAMIAPDPAECSPGSGGPGIQGVSIFPVPYTGMMKV
ncbi:MAG: hypothetical protein O3C10_11880 [Chloroflexi bacterium]|nr:hypothetical protein [Chloroflexota bacterium]